MVAISCGLPDARPTPRRPMCSSWPRSAPPSAANAFIGRSVKFNLSLSHRLSPQAEQRLSTSRGRSPTPPAPSRGSLAPAETELAEDLAVLNRALRGFRLATADPFNIVRREQALVARIGLGAGDQVADGLWSDALESDARPGRERRRKVLLPQARLAAMINGRERALACEDLTFRARLDFDHGHDREAALQLLVALDAALAELPLDPALRRWRSGWPSSGPPRRRHRGRPGGARWPALRRAARDRDSRARAHRGGAPRSRGRVRLKRWFSSTAHAWVLSSQR